MPKSIPHQLTPTEEESGDDDDGLLLPPSRRSGPPSPTFRRQYSYSNRTSEANLRSHIPPRIDTDSAPTEHTSLLSSMESIRRPYTSGAPTPRRIPLSRQQSAPGSIRVPKTPSRASSMRGNELWRSWHGALSARSFFADGRVWYDQFTSTDWVHDSIADGHRVRELRKRKNIKGRIYALFDALEGWILVAIIGVFTACVAYFVDITETAIFDYKEGYCTAGWHKRKTVCCYGREECESWLTWSEIIRPSGIDSVWIDFVAFTLGCVVLSLLACSLTLLSKHVVPSNVSLSTLDEDLGANPGREVLDDDGKPMPTGGHSVTTQEKPPNLVYFSAAGSGVAEVKVILSGFVLHGYLGIKTLFLKTFGLILSVASGLSLGKEGPFVHIATCAGNIACRFFSKYNNNDGKRREVLSAAAASGVAVAFGSPIGGVLFSLEEVSYYFPSKTLFRTFFCCIVAALFLKFLNPYGTGKIVIFEVRYTTDWQIFELIAFVVLGVLGGAMGALFIKASRWWAQTFRRIRFIKKYPMIEVLLVAIITGLISFWNRYTKLAVTELLLELASPCGDDLSNTGLCPQQSDIPSVIRYLLVAFVIKSFLTVITFGIKVPAGIYVPSMVVGGLMGRIVGHATQYLVLEYPNFPLFSSCPAGGGIESCVTPGVYALVAAGATMCGVTRLSVTLAVILFELTGSLDHVLPFSLGVLIAKWTADAIEPLSIYDLLIEMNSYPFLHANNRPVFDNELGDIVPRTRRERIIDISERPLVPATTLREKLELLHSAGELDGGLPILRNKILVGLIPAPDLEFALDGLEDEESAQCLMSTDESVRFSGFEDDEVDDPDPTDLTPYIDPSPMALDIRSPMDLVYQCFVKLGLRYMCVVREGEFVGMLHKKTFVKYCRELEEDGRGNRH